MVALLGALPCVPVVAEDRPKPETHRVVMADGVTLATDVYLPAQGGPRWPVRLIRTPYGRAYPGRRAGDAAAHGFVRVVQDMRGRFDSQGVDRPFADCGWAGRADGVTTLAWLRDQPWCDGRVFTEGGSAMGITQQLLAATAPPGLAGQYIVNGPPDLYRHAAYPGGGFRLSLLAGWISSAGFRPDNLWIAAGRPCRDSAWANYDAEARAADVRVPAVHLAGWYDLFCQGMIDGFVARQERGGPGARGRQKLIIGPWTHQGPSSDPVGELRYPRASRWSPHGLSSDDWFTLLAENDTTVLERIPAVQYYVMGAAQEWFAPGNVWRTADRWPVPATPIAYALCADHALAPPPATAEGTAPAKGAAHTNGAAPAKGAAHEVSGLRCGTGVSPVEGAAHEESDLPAAKGAAHEVSGLPPETGGTIPADQTGHRLRVDPLDPVPTLGGGLLTLPAGPHDQRPIEARPDVLVYTSDVLTDPLEITGRVIARLTVVPDSVELDLSARLTDVYPDGRSMLVCDGLTRTRALAGADRIHRLQPGRPVTIEVDLGSMSLLFNRRHRIRLIVTGSHYPKFDANPQTGWPAWPMNPVRVAEHTLLTSPAQASALILPVVGTR